MKLNRKTVMIVGGVFLVLFILSGYWLLIGRKATVKSKNEQVVTSEGVFPTIDSSVQVDLKPIKKGEVLLSINNAPTGTKSIEFELSYLVANIDTGEGGGNVAQGAIGKCYESNNVWECGEPFQSGYKIVLGTCSSGVCRYHNITGPIKVLLKFSGSYGVKTFEKEYTL
ncbi:MAG: hypothetical protein Q7J11_00585 [Candidatus Roizmanbacteria bacterium]|nr:hypothetical protein [Candidatus Roizmanbacteria bacterium]